MCLLSLQYQINFRIYIYNFFCFKYYNRKISYGIFWPYYFISLKIGFIFIIFVLNNTNKFKKIKFNENFVRCWKRWTESIMNTKAFNHTFRRRLQQNIFIFIISLGLPCYHYLMKINSKKVFQNIQNFVPEKYTEKYQCRIWTE